MSIVFLTSGDKREFDFRDAFALLGYEFDAERSAFGDNEVCGWGIHDPACIIKLHRGVSVYEESNPIKLPSWATFQANANSAVKAYDADHPEP